ncbi:hypothetical protein R1flu_010908 [Riccia fluitans]|uniref:Uncharacterized protein n=1 Tax=Riccia fluitans TaxID=41844 RepID=A0ABD1Z6N5_9MARC
MQETGQGAQLLHILSVSLELAYRSTSPDLFYSSRMAGTRRLPRNSGTHTHAWFTCLGKGGQLGPRQEFDTRERGDRDLSVCIHDSKEEGVTENGQATAEITFNSRIGLSTAAAKLVCGERVEEEGHSNSSWISGRAN